MQKSCPTYETGEFGKTGSLAFYFARELSPFTSLTFIKLQSYYKGYYRQRY